MDPISLRARITGRVSTDVQGAVRLVVSLGAREDDFQYTPDETGAATLVIARSPRGIRTLRTMIDTRRARPVEPPPRPVTGEHRVATLPPLRPGRVAQGA